MCRHFSRRPPVVICVMSGTYKAAAGGSAILVQKDSPLKTLEDLKGKKVAFKARLQRP